jgi:Zn-dependent protease with chaperone function
MVVKGLMLLYAGLLSVAVTFATNWLALIPWRRARGRHWTERARLYHPVRIAAAANLWVVPAIVTLMILLVWNDASPHWALMVLVTAVGAVAGTVPMDREVFQRVPIKVLAHDVSTNWLIRFLLWSVFLAAVALMPNEFNAQTAIIAVAVVTLCILWNHDGSIRVGQRLGLFRPMPQRLRDIVGRVTADMNVPVSQIWLMRSSMAQAFAIPGSRTLLFSERLLQLLSDDEVAAVCAHELAHLTETRADYYKRYVVWLFFLPWIFFKPAVHTFGMAGFLLLALAAALVPALYRRVSHRLEIRADRIAQSTRPETYARALARVYEDNLLPAVHAKDHATHPHLYDRLLAAGVTPDFPRPAPARSMAWHGSLFATAMGLLATILIMRMTDFSALFR